MCVWVRVGSTRTITSLELQPSQHLGDVGAEHPAVVVALVDHDVAQGPEEAGPAGVAGQQRVLQGKL